MADPIPPLSADDQMGLLRRWMQRYAAMNPSVPFEQVDWAKVQAEDMAKRAAAATQLAPSVQQVFDQGLRDAQSSLGRTLAQINFQRDTTKQNYAQQWQQMQQQWKQAREQMPGSYARRGLLNSGIANQGYTDFYNKQLRDTSAFNRQQASQLGSYGLATRQANDVYQQAVANLQDQMRARRQDLASQLRGIQ